MQKLRFFLLVPVLCTLFVLNVSSLNAQDFEGKITYTNTYSNLPKEMKGMEGMLPKENIQYVKGNTVRMEIPMMGGSQVIITNVKEEKSLMLMDMAMFKWAVKMNPEDTKKYRDANKPEVTFLEEYREIQGYKCQKAKVMLPNPEGEAIEQILWITKEIKVFNQNFDYIEGFPMAYSLNQNGMTINVEVTKVDKGPLADDLFEMKIPEGYQEKSVDELMQMQRN